jgi:2-aminoethylphosphonate-pyruvate transaminase
MTLKTAVILAAGLGSRLKTHTHSRPKGLVAIGDKSMVEDSIEKLLKSGIENIIIGTGYLNERYDQLKEIYPQIQTLKSPLYETSSSLKTLRILEPLIHDDFLLLESDIIYEQRGLDLLKNHPEKTVILASGPTQSGDEVYLQATDKKRIVMVSKNRSLLTRVDGELTGLNKISLEDYKKLVALSDTTFETEPKLDYELALCRISTEEDPVYLHTQDDFVWCEVDDDTHFERAQTQILPRIMQLDAKYQTTHA